MSWGLGSNISTKLVKFLARCTSGWNQLVSLWCQLGLRRHIGFPNSKLTLKLKEIILIKLKHNINCFINFLTPNFTYLCFGLHNRQILYEIIILCTIRPIISIINFTTTWGLGYLKKLIASPFSFCASIH